METIDALLKNLSKTFELTNEGGFGSYLSMNASKYPNGTLTMSQPAIIEKILKSLGICNESKMNDTQVNFIMTNMKMEMGGSKNGTIIQ